MLKQIVVDLKDSLHLPQGHALRHRGVDDGSASLNALGGLVVRSCIDGAWQGLSRSGGLQIRSSIKKCLRNARCLRAQILCVCL